MHNGERSSFLHSVLLFPARAWSIPLPQLDLVTSKARLAILVMLEDFRGVREVAENLKVDLPRVVALSIFGAWFRPKSQVDPVILHDLILKAVPLLH